MGKSLEKRVAELEIAVVSLTNQLAAMPQKKPTAKKTTAKKK